MLWTPSPAALGRVVGFQHPSEHFSQLPFQAWHSREAQVLEDVHRRPPRVDVVAGHREF